MTDDYNFQEPADDFRNLTIDEIRIIKTNYKEIKSITHQNDLSRWYNLTGFQLSEFYYLVVGLSCDSRALLLVLNYDANSNSYVYHHIRLAGGNELKRFWCS